ncbi:hypothetical protein Sta7437_3643 [Stanieria cyanosphaera PCC 7437]|uniref:Uncharacterized protein n=1 Tax=Stanieria cyanosphaera (strain ATCC 29371 / PCC 7437) TaxID=111780 RepID=K9XYE6_STAC7|nr:hypothetical protein [Stanieria cyanosphaera]AFZ37141.1 hypothetical protein Sta7437_3643 [Stanieria cyanosphaera PCC 7437]
MSIEIQDEYAIALDSLIPTLKSSYEQMKLSCFSNGSFDYSQAIINRLRAFYLLQLGIKGFLDKKVAQAGSDFFVETILFFLKLFNDVEKLGFEIRSEQAIERKRNALRPDITIWSGTELLAVIECKTQLGWHRRQWDFHFKDRENKIKAAFPKAQVFLVVMSGSNWSGFGDDPRVGQQLFCLLKSGIWPTNLSVNYDENVLETRIEKLFAQLRNLRFDISA